MTNLSYENRIIEWILRSREAKSFDELIRDLHGVFPTDAARILRSICEKHDLKHLLPTSQNHHSASSSHENHVDWLPIPHPLDFDWRFTTKTVDDLIDLFDAELHRLKSLCSLGCPSILPRISQRFPELSVNVVDSNPLVQHSVRQHFPHAEAILADLTIESLPASRKVDAVLLDPPWYPEHMRAFLWNASRICRTGGIIVVCFPSDGTRESIESERESLIAFAEDSGLQLSSILNGVLRYTSPPFERNALANAGLAHVPSDWRIGDLIILRAHRPLTMHHPHSPTGPAWTEVQTGGVRIKVRKSASPPRSTAPLLNPLVPNNVLDTVSQRDPRIAAIDVWTMGNRVFACDNPNEFLRIAREFNSPDGYKLTPSPMERRTTKQIEQLVAVEKGGIW